MECLVKKGGPDIYFTEPKENENLLPKEIPHYSGRAFSVASLLFLRILVEVILVDS